MAEPVQRRLAAILAADVVGYSRLMGKDEEGTLATLTAHLSDLIEPCIAEHRGRVVKTTGDGLLAEFASVVDAVQCAVAFQERMAVRNVDTPDERRIDFRIGVNLGDVIVQDDDVYGDGVNVAARLEGLAVAGGVIISGTVHEHIKGKLDLGFDDLGLQEVKNIAEPVHAYQIRLQGDAAATSDKPLPLSAKPSVAVLPFANMSADPEQEYFSDGITEDIITALSRVYQFFVIARNTTFTYKGRVADVQDIAKKLGVRYVLEGSVRKAGDRVRITVQLIDGETGNHLWAEKYDRELEDIFAVQDEITQTVVGTIGPQLSKAESERASTKKPESLDAWDHYYRGMAHFYRRSRKDFAEAQECFGRAIHIDPEFAPAYSGSAHAHYYSVVFGYSEAPEHDRETAMDKAQKAVDLDPDDPAAYAILGIVSYVRRSEQAIRALQRSLQLNPNSAMTHSALGFALADIGRFDESMKHHEEAVRLGQRDPTLPMIMGRRGGSQFFAGQYEEAIESMKQAASHPNAQLWQYYAVIAASLVELDRMDEARSAVRRVQEVNPGVTLKTVRDFAFSGTEHLDRFVDDLRKAGLPE